MDTIPSSRKRIHSYGTFTRSRSQHLLHRNRSGKLRRDPVRAQDKPYNELIDFRRTSTNCKKPKLDDDELPRLKDLRARRIYSPSQYGDSDCTDRELADLSVENGDTRDDANLSPDLQKEKNGGDCSEKIDDVSGGVPVLTRTLPDGEICGGSKVNEDTPFTESKKNDSALKNKSVLRPRFQGKLFKVPGSVNYKRLFPFLMDTMGDDSGTPQLGFCQKGEEGVQEFQHPLSFQSQEASKTELEADGCTIRGANGLNSNEVTAECLSGPLVEGKCFSESKADSTADYGVKHVGSDLSNDGDFKKLSSHTNNLDHTKTSNHSACTSQEFGDLNEECILTTPPDAEIYDNSKVNVDQLEIVSQDVGHVESMDLTRSTQENAGEGFCLKADTGKEHVPRQHLHRKLFKTPGSVSYKRLLPFLMDLTKDNSGNYGTSKFDHQTHNQEDEADTHAEMFQLSLSSQSEASTNEHKTDSNPMHDTVESNTLENYVLVDPSNELSHGNQPKLTPSQDLPELPIQLDAKEVVCVGLSAPSVNKHIEKFATGSEDECLSVSEFNPCSVVVDDFHSAKNVATVAHNDGLKEVQNKISRQHDSVSPPKDPNMLYINGDVSSLKFEHHSNREKRFTINYDQRKRLVKLDECESVIKCPPGQSLSQLDPNMLDTEENGTSSHAISRSDSSVVNDAHVSYDMLRSPPTKIVSEKSDMAGHDGDKAGSLLKEIVLCSRMPSIGSNNTNAGKIANGSESKITQTRTVLKRCPRFKFLKQAGPSSSNFKRLLPFILNTVKDNSCASVNGHFPKLPKFMDQTPLLPISNTNSQLTPVGDSNGLVPMEHCAGNSGGQQQIGLHACDLKKDSSTSKSQNPKFQSSHDSCKVIKLEDEQVVLNGLCKLESSAESSISVHEIDLPITPLAPTIKEVITTEEKATPALSKSSVFSEVKRNSSFMISSKEKLLETHKCCQSLSQPKVVVGFKKGILKRNPRGCRGICTCLNCVSFRLHAERAFEFSKNQLLDAEEVAHDLMKEISHLRNILERSADSVNNNSAFDGSQVNEACMKAIAAEELAKERLSQMHDDLNIHCRITSLQPPSVTFAVHVEEKVIQPGL